MTTPAFSQNLTSQVGGGTTVFNTSDVFNDAAALVFAGGIQREAALDGTAKTVTITPALTVADLNGGVLRIVAEEDAVNVDITSQVNGSTTVFTVGVFAGDIGLVFVGGIQRDDAVFDGAGGTVTITPALTASDLNGGTLRFFGAPVSMTLSFIDVDLSPLVDGERTVFEVPTPYVDDSAMIFGGGIQWEIAVFGPGAHVTIIPAPQPEALNGGALRFIAASLAVTLKLSSANVSKVEDDGGYPIELTGTFNPGPADIQMVNVDTLISYRCYSGRSGQGFRPLLKSQTILTLATPPMPLGNYFFRITQGGEIASSTTADVPFQVEVASRNWHAKTLALRRVFPPWYKVGPRNLDSVELLT